MGPQAGYQIVEDEFADTVEFIEAGSQVLRTVVA